MQLYCFNADLALLVPKLSDNVLLKCNPVSLASTCRWCSPDRADVLCLLRGQLLVKWAAANVHQFSGDAA